MYDRPDEMFWIISTLILTAAIASIFFLLYLGMRGRSRKIVEQLREMYSTDIMPVTGCGIVSTYSRVPGVLALLRDRIVYKSSITSERGEILLQSIVDCNLEDASSTVHRRARKYRNAKVLVIKTTKGELRLFAIAKSKAPGWENALYEAMRDS
jgi:hypothetical protein